jgi:hypothetical protein
MGELQTLFRERLNLFPFAYLPSYRDPKEVRWLSYFTSILYKKNGGVHYHSVSPSYFEPLYLKLFRLFKGHYPFTQGGSPAQVKSHLWINGIFGGDLKGNRKFLKEAASEEAHVKSLRILVQTAAELDSDGKLIFCESCPDAVVKNGSLVPVCIADRVVK